MYSLENPRSRSSISSSFSSDYDVNLVKRKVAYNDGFGDSFFFKASQEKRAWKVAFVLLPEIDEG
jgi:hypothetical protein